MEYLRTSYENFREVTSNPEFQVDVTKPDKNFSIFLTDLYNGLEDVHKVPGPPPEILAKQSRNFLQYLQKLNAMFDFRPWVLLIYLGILIAIMGVLVDFLIVYILNIRFKIINEEQENSALAFIVFYIFGFFLISVAAYMGDLISPMVDGSGVPELKSILSGANTYKYLDFNIFFPKIIGLTAAYGAGLSVGKVGPMIHLSAVLANMLLKRPEFKHLGKNYATKRSMLSASVGCAVCVALGAPLGGLVYSIEIVIGHFNVTNIFRTFFSICWCVITMKILRFFIQIDPQKQTSYPDYQLNKDIISFVILGLFIGFLTVSFLKMSLKLIYLKRVIKIAIFDRFVFVWISYTIITILSYPLQIASQSSRILQNDVFTLDELSLNPKFGDSPILTLTFYIIIKWLSISLTFACNIPFGIFGPPLDMGAATGRWFAEIASALNILPAGTIKGAYGVAGAAACVSCVVRATAPVIIVLEMTDQTEYAIPVMIAVLTSYLVGNVFSMSFFDVSIYMRKLPMMASLMAKENYEKRAADLMTMNYPSISRDADRGEILTIFARLGEINKAMMLPVVDEEKMLVGAVKIERLLKYLEAEEEAIKKVVEDLPDHVPGPALLRKQQSRDELKDLEMFFAKTGSINEQEKNLQGDSRMVRSSIKMRSFKVYEEGEFMNPVETFLHDQIRWDHELLRYDPSPLTVNRECFASKIQFLFIVTKVTCIFVVERGRLIGCITSPDFLKQKE